MVGVAGVRGEFDPKKLASAATFILDYKDDLVTTVELAAKTPLLLLKLSQALSEAGTQAKNASAALSGKDGDGGALGTLKSSSESVAGIAKHMVTASSLLVSTTDAFGSIPLMKLPTAPMRGMAGAVNGATTGVENFALELAELADLLADAGQALGLLGSSLEIASLDVKKILASTEAPKKPKK